MKRRITALLLLLALLASLAACGGKKTGEGDTYRLGVAVPLTGMGSSAGKMEVVGITMAVNEINDAGGVNGKKLSFEVVDTSGDPKEAANAVRKLASGQTLAIIGPHYSGEAEVTYPIGDELGIVQVALACSKPGLSDGYVYGFRNVATEDEIAEVVLSKWVEDYGIRKVAIITDVKAAVAQNIGEEIFPAKFAALGVEVLTLASPITYQTGDVDFSAQITKAKSLGADGIALGSLAGDALNIITEARRQGVDLPFVGTAPLLEGELEKKGGDDVSGTYSGSAFCLTADSEKIQRFIESYRALAPTMYSEVSSDPLHYCANAYDAVYMIADAIRANGLTGASGTLKADRDAIRDYLAGLTDFDGVDSRGFKDNHAGIKDVFILKIENGQWVEVK